LNVRVIKARASAPLSSLDGAAAIAALSCGFRLIPPAPIANFEDTVEETPEGAVRETCWIFDDTVTADFDGEAWPLTRFLTAFRDLAWCQANASHPVAYLRHFHENLNTTRAHLKQHPPMVLLRKGERTLKLRSDLPEAERQKWLKIL
jgi:hypothetical protein